MAESIEPKDNKLTLASGNSTLVLDCRTAIEISDDVLLKNYLFKLSELEIVQLEPEFVASNIDKNVMFFKITEMVYEKEEFAVYKFASVFNSLATSGNMIFIIVDSDGVKTDFYMGVRICDGKKEPCYVLDQIKNAMKGQFPGTKISDLNTTEDMKHIIEQFKTDNIASVSCVASTKEETVHENQKFVQGLEKFVLAMQGEKYTGIVMASPVSQEKLRERRREYEDIYTSISALATEQINYAKNATFNYSDTDTHGETKTIGHGESKNSTEGTNYVQGNTLTEGRSQTALGNLFASLRKLKDLEFRQAGSELLSSKTSSQAKNEQYGISQTNSVGSNYNYTEAINHGSSKTKGEAYGISQGKMLTVHNKSIENILLRIDRQLKRIDEGESLGMYECSAYFMAEYADVAEMAAATYKGLMKGDNSGLEVAAINLWGASDKSKTDKIKTYVTNFIHPVFRNGQFEVTPCSLVSGNELAIHMGLPRRSVCGLPVIEHADFAKEVVKYDRGEVVNSQKKEIMLGKIFNMGSEWPNGVKLDVESLSMHTFITGSTGSGKSNTVYEILSQLNEEEIRYLIIEPTKGEYKDFCGTKAKVLGTNHDCTELLKINPFKFPQGIHVLEHVDRLVEIFNVCWPMYAAMPAFLKKALLQAYKASGWDLNKSKNKYSEALFPTFRDLVAELVDIINRSAYSEEVRNNYEGALVTRIESLADGLFGEIFSANEIDNNTLFDDNCIIDLSRIGSMETKSLIMGILVMRLNEHRMVSKRKINANLKHITVLEEAHHILKRTSTEQSMEDANVAGKSVEMLANAIAEMRTYGEGFIIVDQSPNAIDVSAIRNTNTKIIMRLPDEQDRRIAGKAAGLKDTQLDEIIRLPKGVAVVYQNDWVEPVLCKVNKYSKASEKEYSYIAEGEKEDITKKFNTKIIEFLLQNEVLDQVDISSEEIIESLDYADMPVKIKIVLRELIDAYDSSGILIKKEGSFPQLSAIITGILEGADATQRAIIEGNGDFDRLTNLLKTYVSERTDNLPKEFILATIQCLMKNHSENNEEDKIIYTGWCEHLRVKGEF